MNYTKSEFSPKPGVGYPKDAYAPKSGRKRSAIWHFFTQAGLNRARCDTCNSPISISGGSTANLIRHIRKKHPEFYVSTVRPQKSQLATIILAPSVSKDDPGISHIEEVVQDVQDDVQEVVQEVIHETVDDTQVPSPDPLTEDVPVSRPSWVYNTRGPDIVKDLLIVLFVSDTKAAAVIAESKLRIYTFGTMVFGKKQLAKLLIDMCKNSNLTCREFVAFGINIIGQYNACECDCGQRILKHECEFLRFLEFCKMIRESDDDNFVELVDSYNWIDSGDMEYFIFK